MQRRKFVKNSILGASALSLPAMAHNQPSTITNTHFQLKYAPHLGMFAASAGKNPLDQLHFMADRGFRAFEDNNMKKREVSLQEKMARTMAKRGIEMGVFVAHEISWQQPNLTSGDPDHRAAFLQQIEKSVEVAKRVNATWMTVVPGYQDLSQAEGFQTAHLVESLKRACNILEPHGLVMVLEPLNFRSHPGQFLQTIPQAYLICKAVASPSCKILFDIFHQQIQEGNLIPNIDAALDEIAYIQVGDNPGRKEPTTGEINYRNVFKHIHSLQKDWIIGMEHGNSQEGKAGEEAVIKAYHEVDGF